MIFEIADLDLKLNTCRFDLKIAMCLIFMKFGTQNKSNMLIMNILIRIDDLDPKFGPKIETHTMFTNFDTQS